MLNLRQVTDTFYVAPQIAPEDFKALVEQGFTQVINNRPDGEEPGQPSNEEMEKAAIEAGIGYAHVPVAGRPGYEEIEVQRQLAEGTVGKVLAYCRSGTRSITTWALGQANSGARSRRSLIRIGGEAGYDLAPALLADL